MSLLRAFCHPCKVEMTCQKNGETIELSPGIYYSTDRYGCPLCGAEANLTTSPYYQGTPGRGIQMEENTL
jgi:hypothetical protein